jgi:aldehyde:ferredoxin oxidoreductase
MIPSTAGKILWVDLSSASIYEEHIPDAVYHQLLSGMGLAAWLLYRSIPSDADPLGAENVLGFVSGLLTCTNSVFSGRWMAVGKSPLTGTWGEANCGGTLAEAIKRCGYDGIFFKGISPQPVALKITSAGPQLVDASALWGMDTVQSEAALQDMGGSGSQAACIGPAAEKLSLIAGINNDGGRMAARSGLGAVMGAKRLKGIILKGNTQVQAADPAGMERLTETVRRWVEFPDLLPPGWIFKLGGTLMRLAPFQPPLDGVLYKMILRKWGTTGMNQFSLENGDAPVKNWRGSRADYPLRTSGAINPDHIRRRQTARYYCDGCSLGCGGLIPGKDSQPHAHKPEFETVIGWSSLLMSDDLELVYTIQDRLNRAGMDSISAAGTVAFAFECFENGLLNTADTDGLVLRWGDGNAILALVDKMITREGIGDLLANGSRIAAKRIGRSSQNLAMHAAGQELPMHDGRNDPGFALHNAVEAAPGRHTTGSQLYYELYQLWRQFPDLPKPRFLYSKASKYKQPEEKARAGAASSKFVQVLNGAGLCLFGAFLGVHRIPIFAWLNAATGWQRRPQEYMEIGRRILTIKQAFNMRQGVPLLHNIPKRALGLPPQKRGANRGRSLDLLPVVHAYWRSLGWDEKTGEPTRQTWQELGLDELLEPPW